jgi:hypothetical protein
MPALPSSAVNSKEVEMIRNIITGLSKSLAPRCPAEDFGVAINPEKTLFLGETPSGYYAITEIRPEGIAQGVLAYSDEYFVLSQYGDFEFELTEEIERLFRLAIHPDPGKEE